VPPDVFAQAWLAVRVLLGDRMIEDLKRMAQVDGQVTGGTAAAGQRPIPVLFAGPEPGSYSGLGDLAVERYRARYGGLRGAANPSLWLLNRLIGGSPEDHGGLLSFLFFDEAFTAPAVRLGSAVTLS
jgi:NTE family protein